MTSAGCVGTTQASHSNLRLMVTASEVTAPGTHGDSYTFTVTAFNNNNSCLRPSVCPWSSPVALIIT